MAKREQFSAHIECKKCGKSGTATWEENENPIFGSERDLIKIPAGFHQSEEEDSLGDPKIVCDVCDLAV